MKKSFVMTGMLLTLLSTQVFSQDYHLKTFNSYRNHVNTIGMITLGTWALGNIAVNSALYYRTERNRKYFCQMNIAWNMVNLTIAGFGLYGALHPDTTLTLYQSIQQQASIEKILLFNAGLDVGYVMTGFFLRERAKNVESQHDRLNGYGNSLLLQGGFLFVFDVTLYLIQTSNHERMHQLLSHVIITPETIGLAFHF